MRGKDENQPTNQPAQPKRYEYNDIGMPRVMLSGRGPSQDRARRYRKIESKQSIGHSRYVLHNMGHTACETCLYSWMAKKFEKCMTRQDSEHKRSGDSDHNPTLLENQD